MKNEIGPLSLALLSAALWGISGTAAQVLFQVYNFSPVALVMIRGLLSGFVILAIFRPKWPKDEQLKLILFAVLGILPSQLFYFIATAYSNIVTALLLEYLFFPMIVIYELFKGKFKLTGIRLSMMTLTAVGILLVILAGKDGFHLSINPVALVSGILSALGVAYYTLFSRDLTSKYGSWSISGWTFLIVGLITLIPGILALANMGQIAASSILTIGALVLVVSIVGTVLAYGFVFLALERLAGTEVSIVTSMEPVFAAISSFFVFGALLSGLQYIGGAFMILAVVILQIATPQGKLKKDKR